MDCPYTYAELFQLDSHPFKPCQRVDAECTPLDQLLAITEKACYETKTPLVISNAHRTWNLDPELFSPNWLVTHYSSETFRPVNVRTRETESDTTYEEFLAKATGPGTTVVDSYAKDLTCPGEWQTALATSLPEYFTYLGCNDLMSKLHPSVQAENMMVYIGGPGTGTPAHTDLCSSIGQNLMTYASGDACALWFVIPSEYRKDVVEFWSTQVKENFDMETTFAPIDIFRQAKFPIHVIQQRPGDFVILPSDCPHQVVNQGTGISIKVSWNRLTVPTLIHAVNNTLPLYRSILKPEVYHVKTVAWNTFSDMLAEATRFLEDHITPSTCPGLDNFTTPLSPGTISPRFIKNFGAILKLCCDIVIEEWVCFDDILIAQETIAQRNALQSARDHHSSPSKRYYPLLDSTLFSAPQREGFSDRFHTPQSLTPGEARCDFCSADIFNRWFHCKDCFEPESGTENMAPQPADPDDGYDLCIHCYALGRTCAHGTGMVLYQNTPMDSIVKKLQDGTQTYRALRAHMSSSFQTGILPYAPIWSATEQDRPPPHFEPNVYAVLLPRKTPMTVAFTLYTQRQHLFLLTCSCCASKLPSYYLLPEPLVEYLYQGELSRAERIPSPTSKFWKDAADHFSNIPDSKWKFKCMYCQLGQYYADHFHSLTLRIPFATTRFTPQTNINFVVPLAPAVDNPLISPAESTVKVIFSELYGTTPIFSGYHAVTSLQPATLTESAERPNDPITSPGPMPSPFITQLGPVSKLQERYIALVSVLSTHLHYTLYLDNGFSHGNLIDNLQMITLQERKSREDAGNSRLAVSSSGLPRFPLERRTMETSISIFWKDIFRALNSSSSRKWVFRPGSAQKCEVQHNDHFQLANAVRIKRKRVDPVWNTSSVKVPASEVVEISEGDSSPKGPYSLRHGRVKQYSFDEVPKDMVDIYGHDDFKTETKGDSVKIVKRKFNSRKRVATSPNVETPTKAKPRRRLPTKRTPSIASNTNSAQVDLNQILFLRRFGLNDTLELLLQTKPHLRDLEKQAQGVEYRQLLMYRAKFLADPQLREVCETLENEIVAKHSLGATPPLEQE
ncbi:hypothetical protein IWQ61_008849 [Dispira simplex]|nr:hypothetical protein IWQ61_008849 [Dispira simplex]